MKEKITQGYNLDVLMSSKIRIDHALGMFTTDAKGESLSVKKSGNGAVIPFLKRYIGKNVVVFVINDKNE
ncbi:MAG: hypothetical protein WC471_01725 [Candidatus Woesearchaeota archaeon]